MEIKVNKIEPQTLEHFDKDDKSLGFLNEYEHNDLRIQIAENEIEGIYLMYNDIKVRITKGATFINIPNGVYDLSANQAVQIIKHQVNFWLGKRKKLTDKNKKV